MSIVGNKHLVLNSVEGTGSIKGSDELFDGELIVTVLVSFVENHVERRQSNAGFNCEVVVCLSLLPAPDVVAVGVEFGILEGCFNVFNGVVAHDAIDKLFSAQFSVIILVGLIEQLTEWGQVMAVSNGVVVVELGLFSGDAFPAFKNEVSFLLGEETIDGVVHLLDADFAVVVLVSFVVHLLEWGQVVAFSDEVIVAGSCLVLAQGEVTIDVELRFEDFFDSTNDVAVFLLGELLGLLLSLLHSSIHGSDELFGVEFAVTVSVNFVENLVERRQLNAGFNCEVVVCLGLFPVEGVVAVGVEVGILDGCADVFHGVVAHDASNNFFSANFSVTVLVGASEHLLERGQVVAFSDGVVVALQGLFLGEELLAFKNEVSFLLGVELSGGVVHLLDADFAVSVLVSFGVHLIEWGQVVAFSDGVIVAGSCLVLAHGEVTVDVELRFEDFSDSMSGVAVAGLDEYGLGLSCSEHDALSESSDGGSKENSVEFHFLVCFFCFD